jgi:hypothetical protein
MIRGTPAIIDGSLSRKNVVAVISSGKAKRRSGIKWRRPSRRLAQSGRPEVKAGALASEQFSTRLANIGNAATNDGDLTIHEPLMGDQQLATASSRLFGFVYGSRVTFTEVKPLTTISMPFW